MKNTGKTFKGKSVYTDPGIAKDVVMFINEGNMVCKPPQYHEEAIFKGKDKDIVGFRKVKR